MSLAWVLHDALDQEGVHVAVVDLIRQPAVQQPLLELENALALL